MNLMDATANLLGEVIEEEVIPNMGNVLEEDMEPIKAVSGKKDMSIVKLKEADIPKSISELIKLLGWECGLSVGTVNTSDNTSMYVRFKTELTKFSIDIGYGNHKPNVREIFYILQARAELESKKNKNPSEISCYLDSIVFEDGKVCLVWNYSERLELQSTANEPIASI